jgi:DNA repair exonuclease SbcCD ATPase subunit
MTPARQAALLRAALDALQPVLVDMTKRCAKDKPHNHDHLRAVQKAMNALQALHDESLSALPAEEAPTDAIRGAVKALLERAEEEARTCEGRVVGAREDEDCDDSTVRTLERLAREWRGPCEAVRAALEGDRGAEKCPDCGGPLETETFCRGECVSRALRDLEPSGGRGSAVCPACVLGPGVDVVVDPSMPCPKCGGRGADEGGAKP